VRKLQASETVRRQWAGVTLLLKSFSEAVVFLLMEVGTASAFGKTPLLIRLPGGARQGPLLIPLTKAGALTNPTYSSTLAPLKNYTTHSFVTTYNVLSFLY
jgi:hypothetical protein